MHNMVSVSHTTEEDGLHFVYDPYKPGVSKMFSKGQIRPRPNSWGLAIFTHTQIYVYHNILELKLIIEFKVQTFSFNV